MKKTVLSLAVLSASTMMAGAAQAEPTIYGKANISLQQIKEEAGSTVNQDNFELKSNASRIGFKGNVEINDSLKAIYKLEYQTAFDDGDESGKTFKQRNIFVGLQGDWGTVMGGMHDSPTKMIGKPVDIFSDLTYADIKNVVAGEERVKNMVMYRSPEMAGFSIDAQFAPGEGSGADGATGDDKNRAGVADSISVAAKYKISDVSLALSADKDVDGMDVVRFVTAYDHDKFSLSALLQTAEVVDALDNEEQTGVVLAAKFNIAPSWKLKAQAGQSTTEADGAEDIDVSQLVLGVDYKLAKDTTLFAYGAQNTTEQKGTDDLDKTTFGIGLVQKF